MWIRDNLKHMHASTLTHMCTQRRNINKTRQSNRKRPKWRWHEHTYSAGVCVYVCNKKHNRKMHLCIRLCSSLFIVRYGDVQNYWARTYITMNFLRLFILFVCVCVSMCFFSLSASLPLPIHFALLYFTFQFTFVAQLQQHKLMGSFFTVAFIENKTKIKVKKRTTDWEREKRRVCV